MLINDHQLIGLRIETKSGNQIGKIKGFSVDTDSQSIFQYFAKPGGISGIFAKELIISRDQVLSITKEKMLVEDNIIKDPILTKKGKAAKETPTDTRVVASEFRE